MATQNDIPIIEDLELVHPHITPWGSIIGVSVAAIIVIALAVFLFMYWRKRHILWQKLTRPQREAMLALEEAFRRWKEMGYVPFLVELTGIVRIYLEGRFGLAAAGKTTTEIEESVRTITDLGGDKHHELTGLLRQCDTIKFAALPVVESHVEKLYEAARGFVSNTGWR